MQFKKILKKFILLYNLNRKKTEKELQGLAEFYFCKFMDADKIDLSINQIVQSKVSNVIKCSNLMQEFEKNNHYLENFSYNKKINKDLLNIIDSINDGYNNILSYIDYFNDDLILNLKLKSKILNDSFDVLYNKESFFISQKKENTLFMNNRDNSLKFIKLSDRFINIYNIIVRYEYIKDVKKEDINKEDHQNFRKNMINELVTSINNNRNSKSEEISMNVLLGCLYYYENNNYFAKKYISDIIKENNINDIPFLKLLIDNDTEVKEFLINTIKENLEEIKNKNNLNDLNIFIEKINNNEEITRFSFNDLMKTINENNNVKEINIKEKSKLTI